MSQWTHFLGVIRYDSMNKIVWPEPPNKEAAIAAELDLVSHIWQWNLPEGSEGPLQVKFHTTNRGPTVLITGDLRDFGKENLCEVLSWVNDCHKAVEKTKMMLILRDAFIDCRVEYDNTKYIIEYDERFVLNVYNNSSKI
ncbi:MAG TPA: hypothetical protein VMW95_05870 [Desulfobacterales bacterium]|nr:hypothetical protein [Desulfobacterales bacterium]